MMHGHEKSRSAIVAVKPMSKAEQSAAEQSAAEPTAAESVERRAETKGNVDQQRTRRTQHRISVSQMLARIRQHIVAVDTRGGNRMRESCTYGSVRGVRGNSHPYRDMLFAALHESVRDPFETCAPQKCCCAGSLLSPVRWTSFPDVIALSCVLCLPTSYFGLR